MPESHWYRSLYWRIALGFVALLAALLIIQGLIFLWMTGRMADFFPSRSPAQFAASLAADVASVIAEHPETDVAAYVHGAYSRSSRAFAIALEDGRTIVSTRVPTFGLEGVARTRLNEALYPGRGRGRGFGFGGGPGAGSPRSGRQPGTRGPFRGGGPGFEFARIVVHDAVAGMVVVPVEPPPLMLALRDLGPTLAIVALVLLAAGTAVGAVVIFRPVRRRLHGLQEAVRAIGAGERGVRAPESGGDEVSALAQAFNEMAGQLEQRTLALEHANRVRRQLLADVSHELTTPLAAIRGYVETLRMDDVRIGEDARRRYLHIVHEETGRLEHIIGDLLDLARLEGGGGAFALERVPLDQLFARIRHRHEQPLAEKGIRLRIVRDPALVEIDADPHRLEQALQNLVANAIRHTPSGGTVSIHASASDAAVVLTVEDTGRGIPPEHLARVFDRFYKVDESRAGTDVPSGSGLGLSIVRAIVGRHHGTITVSNAPPAGARFEIRLPRNPPV
jgi:signal transduction histidine kinase